MPHWPPHPHRARTYTPSAFSLYPSMPSALKSPWQWKTDNNALYLSAADPIYNGTPFCPYAAHQTSTFAWRLGYTKVIYVNYSKLASSYCTWSHFDLHSPIHRRYCSYNPRHLTFQSRARDSHSCLASIASNLWYWDPQSDQYFGHTYIDRPLPRSPPTALSTSFSQ